MIVTHLLNSCPEIPKSIRDELFRIQKDKSSAGGGKKYWAQTAIQLGVYELEGHGLRFHPPDPKDA